MKSSYVCVPGRLSSSGVFSGMFPLSTVNEVVVTLEFHNARLNQLHDRIVALAKKITELMRLMRDQRGIESRLARMDQRIDHIDNSISAIESCLATWMPFITVCMRACMRAHIVMSLENDDT